MSKKPVTVKVGSEEFETVFDDEGVQRFPTNSLFRYLVDSKKVDLDTLCVAYQSAKFSLREYMLFNMGLGYSVSGFVELPTFEHLPIENPEWE